MADEQKVEQPEPQEDACTREGEGGLPVVLDPPPGPSQ
jgi:hypothetical protein